MAHVLLGLALDNMDRDEARALVDEVGDMFDLLKVGDLVDRYGDSVIREFAPRKVVFVDTKLHDTPHTVMVRANVYIRAGATFFTAHATDKVLGAATLIAGSSNTNVIAVTELTSEDRPGIAERVLLKARLAKQYRIRFMTCSGFEAKLFRQSVNYKDMHLVIPGIAPAWGIKPAGQARAMDHREALTQAEGRDCTLIIGRAVTEAKTYGMAPLEVAKRIRSELGALLPPGSILDRVA